MAHWSEEAHSAAQEDTRQGDAGGAVLPCAAKLWLVVASVVEPPRWEASADVVPPPKWETDFIVEEPPAPTTDADSAEPT